MAKFKYEIDTLTSRLDTTGRQLATATDCRMQLETSLEQMKINEQQLKMNTDNLRRTSSQQVAAQYC
jgi:hypothetical protein